MEINTQTVEFIGFLNVLAEMSKNGIRPFSTATAQDKDGLFYDDKNPIEIGDIDEDSPAYSSYPLVANSIINELHHDIISTWTQVYAADGIEVVVMVMADDGESWISITSKYDDDFSIIVENGIWDICAECIIKLA